MKTIIEMAREAGFPFNKFGLLQGDDDNEIDADAMLEHFAELVRADAIAAEREACAKVCDDLPAPDSCSGSEGSLWDVATLECGDAIRNRSNK